MDDDQKAPRVLSTAKDITPELLEYAESIHDDWFDNDEPIDWEDFIDKFTDPYGHRADGAEPFEILEYWNPAVAKIQRHIRAYRKGFTG